MKVIIITALFALSVCYVSAESDSTNLLASLINELIDAAKRGDNREKKREVCPPVYVRGVDHSDHPQKCSYDSECGEGQFCCYFGDTDNKICRLGVPKDLPTEETCRPFPPGHNPDHTYHSDRCYQDSECGRGQKCCFWGDNDAKICRLTVESSKPDNKPDDEYNRPEGLTCPPVYIFNKDHDNHVDRCYADSQCGRGQLCCYWGDDDAKICRLAVKKDNPERPGKCRAIPIGHVAEHNYHSDRCYQDSECGRGQKCCFWGDNDAKICRLTEDNDY